MERTALAKNHNIYTADVQMGSEERETGTQFFHERYTVVGNFGTNV